MTNKEALIMIINRRRMVIEDCNTFLLVRSSHNLNKWKTGGGNFLMAMGLFSVLNFIAKAHVYLTNPDKFPSEEDKQLVKDTILELKKDPKLKSILKNDKTKWIPPSSINEEDAFYSLIKALPEDLRMGIDDREKAKRVWRSYRNELAHMAYPKRIVATYDLSKGLPTENLQDVKDYINKSPAAFLPTQILAVDKLSQDVSKIIDWLCKKIQEDEFKKTNIKRTINWASSMKEI